MYKIDILFLDKEFEHDIYELIRAFYPESEITSSYEEKGADCDLYFRIEKQDDSCMIYYEDNENKDNENKGDSDIDNAGSSDSGKGDNSSEKNNSPDEAGNTDKTGAPETEDSDAE